MFVCLACRHLRTWRHHLLVHHRHKQLVTRCCLRSRPMLLHLWLVRTFWQLKRSALVQSTCIAHIHCAQVCRNALTQCSMSVWFECTVTVLVCRWRKCTGIWKEFSCESGHWRQRRVDGSRLPSVWRASAGAARLVLRWWLHEQGHGENQGNGSRL